MRTLFDLEWQGGAAERSFRRVRPDVQDLPWGTLAAVDAPPSIRDRARYLWTQVAVSEYRAALGFSDVLRALLAAAAPLDLVGMAGGFVADEIAHVEMASRLAMELGGAAPVEVDWNDFRARPSSGDAFVHASECIVRSVCVYETLSGGVATDTMREIEEPLPLGVLKTIARDEARHTRVGWLYLDWAAPRMTDAHRAHLGAVLAASLAPLAPLLREGRRAAFPATERSALLRCGWLDRGPYAASAQRTVNEEVLAPLAKYGIVLPAVAD